LERITRGYGGTAVILRVCVVQPEVTNALSKAVAVTDCSTCTHIGLIERYVRELYRTVDFPLVFAELSAMFTYTCL
jgi:hypothetical protein